MKSSQFAQDHALHAAHRHTSLTATPISNFPTERSPKPHRRIQSMVTFTSSSSLPSKKKRQLVASVALDSSIESLSTAHKYTQGDKLLNYRFLGNLSPVLGITLNKTDSGIAQRHQEWETMANARNQTAKLFTKIILDIAEEKAKGEQPTMLDTSLEKELNGLGYPLEQASAGERMELEQKMREMPPEVCLVWRINGFYPAKVTEYDKTSGELTLRIR